MEELLNKLIEKGWKPRGFEKIYNFGIINGYTIIDTKETKYINFATKRVFREDYQEEQEKDYVSYTYRELVSKESGLRQFCVENKLVNRDWNFTREYVDENKNYILFTYGEGIMAEYYIIESALCKEENLEKFLLENIKI